MNSANPNVPEIELKVGEANQDDVNKGIVRIDTTILQQIGIRPGDIVEIEGSRKTVAIVDRAYPGDIGLNIIRMDGLIRRNAKTGLGEVIKVRKANVKPAKKITIAPARKGILIRAPQEIFKQGLVGRAVLKGDLISIGGTARRKRTMMDSEFENAFNNVFENTMMGFGLGDIKFIVASTDPNGPTLVSTTTEVVFNPESVELEEIQKTPDVSYEDIGGLREEIKKIREMVELPLKHPEIFERLGIEPPKGVLLHGPPGTGKTLLAKAVAAETNSNFSLINGPEIMSKFYGQSEENLRKKFEDAEKNAPSIIFIDEIDAIAPKREETKGEVERRVVAQLLALMDGLQSRGKVVVIAATNIPNAVDPALRRPGRFDREVDIGVPDKYGRLEILKIHTRSMPIEGNFHKDIAANLINEKVKKHLEDNKSKNTNLTEQINKLKEQKNINDQTVHGKLMNQLKNINNKINSLEEIKKVITIQNKLDEIISQIEKIEHSKEIWTHGDPKLEFIKITENKIDEELKDSIANLIDVGILDKNLFNEIRRNGINKDLSELANITHGFVGADAASLAKEAAMIVLRKILPDLQLEKEEAIPEELLDKLKITQADFLEALKVVRPSAMREVLVEIPNIKWNDIGGLEDTKQQLKEAVEWPLKTPEVFTRFGVLPPKGILLYGPPGTGKTLLAKAVANESQANFILVNGPELLSKWVGESERGVRKIFEKARQTSPTIIFFDEMDSIAPKRNASSDSRVTERVVNQLLTEIDGLRDLHGIVVIAATNRPDIMDSALLRPGRFDRIVYVGVPDEQARLAIFKVHAANMKLSSDIELETLAKETNGYVGADIEAICREAAIIALRKNIDVKEISKIDFDEALKRFPPSVTKEVEESYKKLEGHFREARAKEMKEEAPSYFG